MACIHIYPSRAQREHAVEEVTEILRSGGHEERPERLVTTAETGAGRLHAVGVALQKGTPLACLVSSALELAGKIDPATLLRRAGELLRRETPGRRLDHEGDGTVHGVDIRKVL